MTTTDDSNRQYWYENFFLKLITHFHEKIILKTFVNMNKQESLANVNVSARQQCMYEGRYRRNLSSVENATVEENTMSLSCTQPMLFYPVPTPG